VVGSFTARWIATDVALVDKLAYLTESTCEGGAAACWSGLHVLDISNPKSPVERGSYDFVDTKEMFPIGGGWYIGSVTVLGKYAYLAGGPFDSSYEGPCSLEIMDISNPAQPLHLSTTHCQYPDEVWLASEAEIQNGYAYLTDGFEGLLIIDISDPTNPQKVSQVNGLGGIAQSLALADKFAYVATQDSGISLIDISNPLTPELVATFSTGYKDTTSIELDDDYVYVGTYNTGLHVMDVSTPLSPREVARYDTTSIISGITLANGYIYLATEQEGLLILQFTPPTK
jgi:hypothetical protein